jgi:predicted XRE-type DNA-binding protein
MSRTSSEITIGSGNVFADIGMANPEEALAKAQLTSRINTIIEERGLTQVQAAALLNIDQPKVSALKCGHLSAFSIERLLRFLLLLDQDINIAIKQGPRSRKARLKIA